jgi:hypothetical protein
MYRVCNQKIPRLTSRPRERRNKKTRRVSGIKRATKNIGEEKNKKTKDEVSM